MKHYALVVVVKVEDGTPPERVWESVQKELGPMGEPFERTLAASAVYLSDPFEVVPPQSAYWTRCVTLVGDEDRTIYVSESALE